MELLKVTSHRFSRFLLVGTGNSAVNFAVLNMAYYGLHTNKITSSIVATTCAIIFSFVFNRSFVFRDKDEPLRKFVRFAAVSAGGVLLIQTSAYALSVTALQHYVHSSFALINLSNLIASFVVMFWNYNGYRLLVFIEHKDISNEAEGNAPETEA